MGAGFCYPFLGAEAYNYDAARMLVYSVDIPVTAQITKATLDEPYLGIRIELDPARIAELTTKVLRRPPETNHPRSS